MQRGRRGAVAIVAALACLAGAATAQQASREEVEALKRALEEQQKAVEALKARLEAMEAKEAEAAPAAEPPVAAPAIDPGVPRSPIEDVEAEASKRHVERARERYRGNFEDRQEAAARAGDYTLDPTFRGFIPVPNTAFMIKFNPRPRLDMTYDSDNAGSDMRFVPGLIPVEGERGYGGGGRFNANGNGSQMRVDVQAPNVPGNLRFFYQNDFFGSDDSNFRYRLQHFYGQFYGVVAGYTYGVFEDPDAWPDTVDYEGPNAVIFARRPLVHYKRMVAEDWQLTLAVEDPDVYVDLTGDDEATRRARMPDLGFNVRWVPKDIGHVQFSTIFRSIGVDNGMVARSQDVLGWGVNLAGSLNVSDSDTIQFWTVYGAGVGGMGNDSSFFNSDAALRANGDLVALDYFSGLLAYSHNWTPRWRSTATYGYVKLQNTELQLDTAYDQTHYASLNLVYKLFKRMSIGVEGLYGNNQVRSGADADVFRLHVGLLYALFD